MCVCVCPSSLALSDSLRSCGAEALSLWAQMKQRDGLAAADGSGLRALLEVVLATAEVKHTSLQSRSVLNQRLWVDMRLRDAHL